MNRQQLVFLGALALLARPLLAAETPPPANPPEKQAGMANYSMSGMTADEKRGLTQAVTRQNKQLGHGMGGLGNDASAAPAGAKAKKGAKKGGKKKAGKAAKKKSPGKKKAPVRGAKAKRAAR